MSFSIIFFLVFIMILAIYSFAFLTLNDNIISVDLLFIDLDIETGQIILFSILIGILIALFLELLFFSTKKKKNGS